ncbi:MAG: exo-alpha-sialidase [Verrucomicrobia bacterium]|nr:exo-alpha-sialidase [Verrucomicrobiota bacterium]
MLRDRQTKGINEMKCHTMIHALTLFATLLPAVGGAEKPSLERSGTTVNQSTPDWAGRATDGKAARIAVPAPEDPRYHHLGWPKAVRTADGTIVLGFLMGRKHVGENCPAVSLSTDGGQTFSAPKRLKEFGKDKDYGASGNMALGIAHDGSVLLLSHGYSPNACHIFGWRSTDNGRTWKPVDTSALGPNKAGSSTGHIVQLPGKRLMAVGHYRDGCQPHTRGIWRSISEDDGLTWGEPSLVTTQHGVEPVLVRHENRLLVFIRNNSGEGAPRQLIAVSDDWGKTWRTELSNIGAVLPGTRALAHPFAMMHPHRPGELLAVTFERGPMGAGQLWRGDPATLKFTHERTLVELSKQSVKTHNDYGYGWLVPMEGRRALLFYYHGRKDGPASIWVLETEI